MRDHLIEEGSLMLLKGGFTVKRITGCFDVIARKGIQVFLAKFLEDANSIAEDAASEMRKISSFLGASTLIIAEKVGSRLEDNIVYTRFGIQTISLETLRQCIARHNPIARSTKAGISALVNGEKLREARAELGYSLAELSGILRVSRSMIARYEKDFSEISISRAMKLYDLFGEKVFDSVDVLGTHHSPVSNPASNISRKYVALGFSAADTRKAPFDIIAKKGNEIILTEVGDVVSEQLQELTKLLDAEELIIFRRKKPKNLPALTTDEFFEFGSSEELIKFVKEFS